MELFDGVILSSKEKIFLDELEEGPSGILKAPSESVSKHRNVILVPTQEAGLALLKQSLGIRGKPKKTKDDDDKSDRKSVISESESESDLETEDSEEEDSESDHHAEDSD
jgi:hypothetical protein